jgi:DNA-binding NarL/FixJ family response regulator
MSTNIIVADDHPLFRQAIVHLLNRSLTDINIQEVSSFGALTRTLEEPSTVSLVLLDLKLGDTQGIDGLLMLKKQFPALPVIIVSAYDDKSMIQNAMRYGASGFISKSLGMDEMAQAINSVLDGDLWFPSVIDSEMNDIAGKKDGLEELTSMQLKVLLLLKEGKPSKEMASMMSVTEATIKAHLTEIFRKLNVRNRTQAVVVAREMGLSDEYPEVQ